MTMLTFSNLPASLDEHAFRRLPEVGAAPDMIEDDLPTNPDYLDEHFGAAAGLREFSDDEFEESDPDSPSVVPGVETPAGVSSAFGGETIRMLRPEGIRVIDRVPHAADCGPQPSGVSPHQPAGALAIQMGHQKHLKLVREFVI